jgi:hypothetical protein
MEQGMSMDKIMGIEIYSIVIDEVFDQVEQ